MGYMEKASTVQVQEVNIKLVKLFFFSTAMIVTLNYKVNESECNQTQFLGVYNTCTSKPAQVQHTFSIAVMLQQSKA